MCPVYRQNIQAIYRPVGLGQTAVLAHNYFYRVGKWWNVQYREWWNAQ